jgi:hypothetical protein
VHATHGTHAGGVKLGSLTTHHHYNVITVALLLNTSIAISMYE